MAAQICRHRPFRSSGPPTIGTLVQMASALRDRVWRTRGTRVVVGDVKLLAGACSPRSEGAATLTVAVPAWETLVSGLLTLPGTECVPLLIAENATASQWSDSSSD